MTFPLYRRPGGVIFLDDDPAYLEMLAVVMPAHWRVELYLRPQACVERLAQEPPQWEADAWEQQQMVNRWREGQSLIPQILEYWAASPSRFGLTHVCVVDYSMPAMNGLQMLGQLVDWPGACMLLTGRADEQIAVNAFNEGLIEQFVAKQSSDITRRLSETIQRLLDKAYARHTNIWRSTLSHEQDVTLRDQALGAKLEQLCHANKWVEHVVIGQPFGLLGFKADGAVDWLQLERTKDLAELAELAQSQGIDAAAVANIRAGRELIDLELQLALQLPGPPRIARATDLGDGTQLCCAVFAVAPPQADLQAVSYEGFHRNYAERLVRD
jgi:CheY-like chemotaxis protein